MADLRTDDFHVLTVGWDLDVIGGLADPIERATGYRFSHLLDPALDRKNVTNDRNGRFLFMRDDIRAEMPPADRDALAKLELSGVPTIHNMIMGDRRVRELPYDEALRYATFLAQRIEQVFRDLKPSVVIGGFDSIHSGIALGVARKMGLPWFAMNFTSLPLGQAGFCTSMTPESSVTFMGADAEERRALAEKTLREFEERRASIPAYLSANSLWMVAKRLPSHLRALSRVLTSIASGRHDKFTQPPVTKLVREYVRKRVNLLRLPLKTFMLQPPERPYLFIGLHMQPESSIDVWAPFFSDQLAVIESVARAMPASHDLLVKLHKSDADNYSRAQLDRFRSLPGVRLVSPFADSRRFVEGAALVVAIQGNIALEAALLGKPVLLFGGSRFIELPSVTRAQRHIDLPAQIREKLSESKPDRESIVRGLASYLSYYAPGCYNNWDIKPSPAEIQALAEQFRALRRSLEANG